MKVFWVLTFPGLFIIVALNIYRFFSPISQFVVSFNGLNGHQNPLSFFYLTISSLSILIWAINYTFSLISAIIHRGKIEWLLLYILTLLTILIGLILLYFF